ncbi:MAG: hypothetical protein WCR72_00815 [Bacteroidota bacterium]
MKRISHIIVLFLLWILCGADSCNSRGREAEMNEKKLVLATKDSLKKVISVDTPGPRLLQEYDAKAVQKLGDFAGYLEIAADTSLDMSFRQQAAAMAVKLFVHGSVNMEKWYRACGLDNCLSPEELMDKCLLKGLPCSQKLANVMVDVPLTSQNDSVYKGCLSFSMQGQLNAKSIEAKAFPGRLYIDIYAIKETKAFGAEKLCVWSVYLGSLNELRPQKYPN